jgi:hypothetical protein
MKWLFLVTLLFCACLFLDIVIQPSSVTIGERFTIIITGTYDSSWPNATEVWLALLFPQGFTVDSICYVSSDTFQGVITASDWRVIDYMESRNPPDSGMRWLAFLTELMLAETSGVFTAIVFACATDSTVPGQYLIDYYLGDYAEYITIRDSILDQPIEVTEIGISEARAVSGIRVGRVRPSLFRDQLSITMPEPSDVSIFDLSGQLVQSLYVKQVGFWDGTDKYGRRVPAGVYLVHSKHTFGRVTLVD